MEEAEDKQGPDFERIGLFKEMGYLEGHGPLKIDFITASEKGKQMMTECSKSKKGTQDGYFEKTFPRVFEGEAYTDPIRLRRLNRLEQAKKNPKIDFKYTSPSKKPCGLGSNYGTFADYDQKMEYFSSKTQVAKPGPPPKKNFYTNPGKKGTGYGYANLTLSKTPPYFLEKEYEDLKEAMEETPKRPEPRSFEPYRAGRFQQGYFDPNPYSSTLDQEDSKDFEEKDEEESGNDEVVPFIPPSPAKKDGGMKDGCLNKFPEYVGEPHIQVDMVPRGVKHHVNKANQMFRPVPGPKPYPVKSIITKNVQRKVTPQNFENIKGVVYCKSNNTKKHNIMSKCKETHKFSK